MSQSRPAVGALPRRGWLYVCFVASGAAGLILEIVWSKYLSLLLGNSIYGVATVVASFLGGLGIGAWLGGRIAGRAREPLRLYARLELTVGLWGRDPPRLPCATAFAGSTGRWGAERLPAVRFLLLAVLLPRRSRWGRSAALASDFPGAPADASVGVCTRSTPRERWEGLSPRGSC
jgi:hypothetical protein